MIDVYEAAEQELVDFFTSSLGVGAQKYEPTGHTAYDANEVHLRLRNASYRKALQKHAAVERTVAQLGREARETLAFVYTPHGWPGLLPVIFEHGRRDPEKPRDILVTFGSFVALAIRSDRLHGKLPSPLEWLADQAGRGDKAPTELFKAIYNECAAKLRASLYEYEPLRKARVAEAKSARQAVADERARFRRLLAGG